MTKLVQSMIQPVPGRTSASPLSDSFWKAEIHKYLGKLRENLLTWNLAYILHICLFAPYDSTADSHPLPRRLTTRPTGTPKSWRIPFSPTRARAARAALPAIPVVTTLRHTMVDASSISPIPSARGPRGPRALGDNCSWLVAAVIDSDVFFVVFIGYKPRTEYDGDLVGGDWNHGTLWLSICWEFHIPNWRTHIFQRGSIPPARQWFSGPTCTDRATVPLDDTQYLNLSDCAGQLSCTLNTRHDLKDMAQTASYLTATIFWQAHNGSRKICQRKTQKYHEISINMQKCCNVNPGWINPKRL